MTANLGYYHLKSLVNFVSYFVCSLTYARLCSRLHLMLRALCSSAGGFCLYICVYQEQYHIICFNKIRHSGNVLLSFIILDLLQFQIERTGSPYLLLVLLINNPYLSSYESLRCINYSSILLPAGICHNGTIIQHYMSKFSKV